MTRVRTEFGLGSGQGPRDETCCWDQKLVCGRRQGSLWLGSGLPGVTAPEAQPARATAPSPRLRLPPGARLLPSN